MSTLKDVARRANVSIATVSKVVNKVDSYMSDETRQKVEAAIEECGYIPNMVARGLKTKKTNTIGFILPDIMNPFYAEIAKGIEIEARERGYSLIICDTCINLEAEVQAVELLKSKMVDGIILGPRMFWDDEMDPDTFGTIPVILVGRIVGQYRNKNWGQVSIDERRMIQESVLQLKNAGCEKIALITAKESDEDEKNLRLKGFLDAMRQQKLEVLEERIILDEYDLNTGYNGLKQLLEKKVELDGVVCGNDLIAIGAINAARDYGIVIPQELKIIGFDNIPMAEFTNPRLTTIAQPAYQMGKAASAMMIDYIERKKEMEVKFFQHTYVKRETV